MTLPNIYIARDTDRYSAEIERIGDQIVAQLGADFDLLHRELLKNILTHTPVAYFQRQDVARLGSIFVRIFHFFAHRQADTRVCIIPAACTGRYPLLLVNADDAPYLLDSTQMLLNRESIPFRVICHPILTTRREKGHLAALHSQGGQGTQESLQLIELHCGDDLLSPELTSRLSAVVLQTLEAASNCQALCKQLRDLAKSRSSRGEQNLLGWLCSDNFVPLQYRSLLIDNNVPSGFTEDQTLSRGPKVWPLLGSETEEKNIVSRLLMRERDLVFEELECTSPICRPEPLIYFGLRVAEGDTLREHMFCGFFTAHALDQPVNSIPALHERIDSTLQKLKFPEGSYDYRKSFDILNDFPKEELFQLSDDELGAIIQSFSYLYRYRSVKVLATRNLGVKGLTFLIMLPREFYDEQNRIKIENFLRRTVNAEHIHSRLPQPTADYLSFLVHARVPEIPEQLDNHRIEHALTHLTRPWALKLQILLQRHFGEDLGRRINDRYTKAFCGDYRQAIHPRFAVRDVALLEQVAFDRQERFDLWGPFLAPEPYYRLQFYSPAANDLNSLFPLLENLGLSVIDEVDFKIELEPDDLYIKSFKLRSQSIGGEVGPVRKKLLAALHALRSGAAENDYLNRLLLPTGLNWRQIDVFRGYRNYYFQLGNPYTKKRVAFSLIKNPRVTQLLFDYFTARFKSDPRWVDPLVREEEALMPLRFELLTALNDVADVNEDTILRALFNLIDSTVRTNFFVRTDHDDYFFSFKISAIGITEMPAPRPLYEVYVHSSAMEGIHLRGGMVARGGIRWSDRPDDFRTEVLGLMKTQMTKNALIVPAGSKGGFIVKGQWHDRETGARLSREAYQTLMRGLLDLTDNRSGDEIVRPAGIVAYDDVDPYLVVAADKGTAHLPDTANAVATEYEFWLDDAFASGGSNGYDHKKLGITARGAWECVKTHFREAGINPEVDPITVVGIGDMSGDVFGNGMLCSKTIKLRAAFDHRHIFLDPDPDPDSSWTERKRLFDLPRSSWEDYASQLISAGGGVYPRQAKDIPLSAEVREWLGLRHESLDGESLIRKLLTAPTDLLWNGGIGTYVKASDENDEMAGDRANDNVRVNASDLKAKVFGEGGNLGLTQKARIEYANLGGRINTDAIDNSAGVDCSDHEVNLKILMQQPTVQAQLTDADERNKVLEEVTDSVCDMVLKNNYRQSVSLSLDLHRCSENPDRHLNLADRLDRAGMLDRRGESIPPERVIMARERRRYERPELAILMAYAKMHLFQVLVDSELPDRPVYRAVLNDYFPAPIRERFANELPQHPLSSDIIATCLTNDIIDQAGATIIFDLMRETAATPLEIAERYLLFNAVVDGPRLRELIYALDYQLSAERQRELLLRLEHLLRELCRRTLKDAASLTYCFEEIERLRTLLHDYAKNLGGVIAATEWDSYRHETECLRSEGFDDEAARTIACLPLFADFIDIATLAADVSCDFYTTAGLVNEVSRRFSVAEVITMISVHNADLWERQAADLLISDMNTVVYQVARQVVEQRQGNLDAYCAARRRSERSYQKLLKELRGTTTSNLHPFTVLLASFRALLND